MSDLIITHVDLDGVCSAAIAKRYLGSDPYVVFASPKRLDHVLRKVREGHERIVITDLSLNHDIAGPVLGELRRLASSGSKIIWVDHHAWESDDVESVSKLCELTLEGSPSAASLFFRKYMSADEVSKRIAEIGDDADTNTNALENTLAYKFGTWELKNRLLLLESFAHGKFDGDFVKDWKEQVILQQRDSEKLVAELTPVKSESGKRFAVIDVRGTRAQGTYAAKLAAQKLDLDFIAVIYSCKSVSFYRGVRDVDLLGVAKRHGGGGHAYACGANLRPSIYERILCFLSRRYRTKEIRRIIEELRYI
ncbi:MAG: DHH family phosphoesterase [Thermoprotei archaeon]